MAHREMEVVVVLRRLNQQDRERQNLRRSTDMDQEKLLKHTTPEKHNCTADFSTQKKPVVSEPSNA